MSIFEYTLPSGSVYVVNGPPGATREQADLIFYEQVAAGSLVGYTAGQTLTGTATQLTKFELSRLDRGIAGVDSVTVLAVIQGLPVVTSIPSLVNIPLENPINQADIVINKNNTLGPDPVGILSDYQVQVLLAQIAKLVDQASTEVSQEKGIGAYGLNCLQLEQAGYVKPGTSERYLTNPDDFITVMNSPAIWTGLNGINSLYDLVNDFDTQTRIQTTLMQQAYESLSATGVISQYSDPAVDFVNGQVYTQSGLQTVSALTLLGGNLGSLNGLVLNSQAQSTLLNQLVSNPVTDLSTLTSGAVTGVSTDVVNLNFNALNKTVSNQITDNVGALVTNASKFGTQAAAGWVDGTLGTLGNIPALSINTVTTGITALANANLNSLQNYITNLSPGNLSDLNAALNTYGKAAQYSLSLSNQLGGIANLANLASLGNLQGLAGSAVTSLQNRATTLLTGTVAGIQGQAQAIVNGLQGQAQALTSQAQALAGSLTNFANLGNLFDGGGDLVSGTQIAAGFSNTVNRSTVNAAFTRILGSAKIPVPTFEYPSLNSALAKLDITQAQNILNNIRGQGQAIIGQGQAIAGQVTGTINQAQSLATQAQNTVNRLV